jgi:hypothetical protein
MDAIDAALIATAKQSIDLASYALTDLLCSTPSTRLGTGELVFSKPIN